MNVTKPQIYTAYMNGNKRSAEATRFYWIKHTEIVVTNILTSVVGTRSHYYTAYW